MGMRLKGMTEAQKGFVKLKKELPEAADETADKSTDLLYKESQKQVPVKTSALKNSGRKIDHSRSGPKRSIGVKYGYPGEGEGVLDYAAAVHEILKASHAPPTKAKYVEEPLVQGVREYESLGGMACQRAVGRSF